MKETFVCIDCKQEYPRGLDVESDMYLNTDENNQYGGSRCVFCYNDKTHYPLNVEQCYHHAHNLALYGVAITDDEIGKTWDEISGGAV